MSWGERLQMFGIVVFFGSVILGLPVFGIGWHEPHASTPRRTRSLFACQFG
jgi:hypothetical protein